MIECLRSKNEPSIPYCRQCCNQCKQHKKCTNAVRCYSNKKTCGYANEVSFDDGIKLDCPF